MEAISLHTGSHDPAAAPGRLEPISSFTIPSDHLLKQLFEENHRLREEISRLRLFLSLDMSGLIDDQTGEMTPFGLVCYELLPAVFTLETLERLLDDLGFEPSNAVKLIDVFRSNEVIEESMLGEFRKQAGALQGS